MTKLAWSVDDYRPCCNNCIYMIDNGQTFSCGKEVNIKDNHFSKLNSVVCGLHKYYKSLKRKVKTFKNKSARF